MRLYLFILIILSSFAVKSQIRDTTGNNLSELIGLDINHSFLPPSPPLSNPLGIQYFEDLRTAYYAYSIKDLYPFLILRNIDFDSTFLVHKMDWDFSLKSIKTILVDLKSKEILSVDLEKSTLTRIKDCTEFTTSKYQFLLEMDNSLGPYFTSQGNEYNTREYVFDFITSSRFSSFYIDLKGVLLEEFSRMNVQKPDDETSVLYDINQTDLWSQLDCFFEQISSLSRKSSSEGNEGKKDLGVNKENER